MTSENVDEALQLAIHLFEDTRVFLAVDVYEKVENFLKEEPNHPIQTKLNTPAMQTLIANMKDKDDRLKQTLSDVESVSM